MKKKLLLVVGVGLLLAILVGGIAMAQEVPPTTASALSPLTDKVPGPDASLIGFHMPQGGWSVYDAVAEALNLTPTELFERLHSGQTLAEIAEAQGVDPQTVRDAARTARQEAARQAIEQAVEDGKITQEHADWMLQGLDNGWSFPPRRIQRGHRMSGGPRGEMQGGMQGAPNQGFKLNR